MRISKRKFQNLLLLLGLTALSTMMTSAKKGRAADYFPPGIGVKLNVDDKKFEDEISKSDQLVFLYVFDSQGERSQ